MHITLTCTASKFLEHIILSHIIQYLEINHILTACQHGFRQPLSTATQLTDEGQYFAETINSRGESNVVYFDLSKASYRVFYSKLLVKLSSTLKNRQLLN